jgi:hypothetical protein
MDAPFRGGDAVKLYAPATSTRRGLIAHLGRKYGRQNYYYTEFTRFTRNKPHSRAITK